MNQDELNQPPDHNWGAYYESLEGREPRPLFTEVLARFNSWTSLSNPSSSSPFQQQEIDLGCGDGAETLALLDAGWSVLAIDSEPAAITNLRSKAAAALQTKLETMVASFEELLLPKTDLVYAGYSLPFYKPDYFEGLWANVTARIRPEGRFAGQLFGIRDSWADNSEMTFHSAEQVTALLAHGFEIEIIEELDEDGNAFIGPKHWHVFDIIVRKLDQ